ncbi:MAG: NEW3 domain-containing protein [Armatimonadota bacterium]|nr:NEW3 domain-containing protein [Armatimonadota bacterium]MDR5704113.1 NEW3 domain-containing protein [Armatimonadota bacterium]
MKRCTTVGIAVCLVLLWFSLSPSLAQEFRGLSFSTPYPDQTIRAGETVTLTLTVRNHKLPPQVVLLRVLEAPRGWKATFLGGGRPVGSVYVGPDQEATVSLRIEPPRNIRRATYRFRLLAQGQNAKAELPLALTIGELLPPRLTLQAELPVLRGPATSSFRYRLTLKNESDVDLLVNLEAQAPKGFQVSFTPAFGSQQVTSLPIKAGESRDLDAEVSLPSDLQAGRYDLMVVAAGGGARAQVRLGLEVTGRPELSITTPEGRLSGRAYAGRSTPVKLVIKNQGTAPARNVELSAFEPTGWEVKFDPQRIAEIPANGQREATVSIKPADKAVAGDYMVTLRATSGDNTTSVDFRVTVLTSTLWGIAGILLVAVSLGVVGLAVSRYGRR